MNPKMGRLCWVSILFLSQVVNSEGWIQREREPVDRNGLMPNGHRRTKGNKSEKKYKKDKNGKEEKKDSKDKKAKFSKSGKSYDNTTRHHDEVPTIREGSYDEDTARDIDDFYDGFFESHFSLGSMSMGLTQSATTNSDMLTLKHIPSNENPTLEQAETRDNPTNPPLKTPVSLPTNQFKFSGEMTSTSQEDVRIPLTLYSLVFSFMDCVIPTRRNDYNELVATTKLVMRDFMIHSYASNNLSDLNDFEVEFVRTGISESDEIFIVFQSTAIFNSDSYAIPDAPSVQNLFENALHQEEELWMEYITALQELNPDNAFSSTVDVIYITGFADEMGHFETVSSTMDNAAYTAAAGIAFISIVAFAIKSRRDQKEFEDPYFNEKKSTSKSIESCASTVAESMTYLSSSICGDHDEVYTDGQDEEINSSTVKCATNDVSTNHQRNLSNPISCNLNSTRENESIHGSLSEENRDRTVDSGTRKFTYSQDGYHDVILNTSVSGNHIAHKNLGSESMQFKNNRRDVLQERSYREKKSKKYSSSKPRNQEEKPFLLDHRRLSKNNGNPRFQVENHFVEHPVRYDSTLQLKDRSMRIEELKKSKEKEILEGFKRSNDDEGVSQEKLRTDLAIIEAEEAARNADELRLKKERRLARERESSEKLLRFREYARQARELKLERPKSSFEPHFDKKVDESLSLDVRNTNSEEGRGIIASRYGEKNEGPGIKSEREQEIHDKSLAESAVKVDENPQLIDEIVTSHETFHTNEGTENYNDEIAKEKALAADILMFQKLRIEKLKKQSNEANNVE